MTKQMICTIGYQHYAVDPHDAVLLLDVAQRMTAVDSMGWDKPYRPKPDAEPFVTSLELREVDMEPEPPEPEVAPVQPPAPLQITEQRKITHDTDDLPF